MNQVKDLQAVLRQRLEEQNIRLTRRRKAVLAALIQESDKHLSAEDVYLKVKEAEGDIGLATVYRTLELFNMAGIIHAADFGDGCKRFEVVADNAPHYHHHLVCLGCGRIIEFSQDLLEDLEQQVGEKTGFKIVNHSLRFYGYCRECQEKNPAAPASGRRHTTVR
ncbi:Fur family transcriptional regulator [Gelria sp. Kuro-4]|uniref:Fur family transcriptional regulator n=1 Tax=Gelria sp. Kuro-4 TaxID=2796927 RepID=UPI001BEE7119|nr:Fur family transcriptional regulator [Gelria sp. Kuro-4]MDI3522479.1 Fur family transcriptional regulator, ferric uptake regulator [Bacillota bacterium]BCV25062.1 transcriptional repressor [Gelria sp. Kuro-4]